MNTQFENIIKKLFAHAKAFYSLNRNKVHLALFLILLIDLSFQYWRVYYIERVLVSAYYDNDDLKDEIDRVKSEVSDHDDRLSDLDSKTSDLDSKASDFENDISQNEDDISRVKSDLSDLESRISNLESQIMKIAILSDGHDGIGNIISVVEQIQKIGAEVLLFCGDFCAPGAGRELCQFKGPIYAIFGNNDGDKMNIANVMNAHHSNVTFMREGEGMFELDGRKIAMTHYPSYADALARTGDYDLVAFGHDHQARIETHGKCLAVNPGCLNQVRPSDKMGFAIYDSKTHSVSLHDIGR